MRVLFSVSNWPGHWSHLVPVGWALQAAGHEVRVACAESEVDPLAAAGLTPVALQDAWPLLLQARLQNWLNARDGIWPYGTLPPHPVTGEPMTDLADFDLGAFMAAERDRSVEMARASTNAVVDFARSWQPDLVLHDTVNLEGLLAAKVTGVPAVCALWGPVGTEETQPGLKLTPVDFSRAFARYGLGEMHPAQIEHVLDPCPDALRPVTSAARIPVAYVPYNGPGAMPPWLLEPPAKRRVCVVWGHSATRTFGAVAFTVPAVLAALSTQDVEVVVTANERDLATLGGLPANARAVERVPLHLLLPSCDLVVHYAGAGCAMTSVVAGVPQLTIPNGFDQYMIGRRVAAAGAGIDLPNHVADEPAIRAAARALLREPRYRAAARRLGEQARRRPSPAELVGTLAELAGRGRAARAS